MRLLLATDAWAPQVNGVVRTYENTCAELKRMGNEVEVIQPQLFKTFPCPTYPDIKLAMFPRKHIAEIIPRFGPDAIHIATEGPIGYATRAYCMDNNIPFTTSFHTQFPEYVRMRAPVPMNVSYSLFRRFHSTACRTMVPTDSQRQKLLDRGFKNVVIWSRGVNTEIFKPYREKPYQLPGPVFLYMGRVAGEKNIGAFLDLDLPGSKVVVGDGPDLLKLKKRHKDVLFTGFKFGRELAEHISAADVFVFPSLTDTFGIVLLEAMACGVPVAAFPVTGPIDVVTNGITGVLDQDLGKAARAALELNPQDCINFAQKRTWHACTQSFLRHLQPAHRERIYTGNRLSVEY